MELKDIKGFGAKRIEALNEKEIFTPLDLLKVEPIKYLDYSNIIEVDKKFDGLQTVKVQIVAPAKCAYFKGKSTVTVKVIDVTSNAVFTAVWYNQPFMKSNLKEEAIYYLTGRFNRIHQFVVQKAQNVEKVDYSVVPVYGASAGLTGLVIISAIKQILDCGENYSVLSRSAEQENGLMSLNDAFFKLHFPCDIDTLERAKERINFEDMLLLASLESKINAEAKVKTRKYDLSSIEKFKSGIPFVLTDDQEKVLDEIAKDLDGVEVMNRLVLGDVGSGKTLVAFGASFIVKESGFQSVMLCPTEILAEQHFATANKILKPLGVTVALLHSKLATSEKREVLEKLKTGAIDFLISTHSSLSEKVVFSNLGLVITDEQHRFGVAERAGIEKKGENPDVLVMSATPIPRSLSLVLFGGLKVSEINSRPNGESKISTKLVPEIKERDMWVYLLKEIDERNGKCFVIVPRIKEGESSALRSVVEVKKRLVELGVPNEIIGSVHGKTEKVEAGRIIEKFKRGDVKVLVSTTIVEVGIDVPTANLMVIYNADRFGLATLHQLRGRVGRDGREGFCFAISDTDSETARSRLEVFKKYNSGIKLAEEDLKIRGAGTMYGTKQHGASEIFLNINFSVEEYTRAKEIIGKLSQEELNKISSIAEDRFGNIYKNVVFN